MAGTKREVAAAEYLVMKVEAMVDQEGRHCSFDSFDEEKNRGIKKAISPYTRSWVLPYAKALAASLRGDATPSQLALLDDVKTRGF